MIKQIVAKKGIVVIETEEGVSVFPSPRDYDLGFGVCDGKGHFVSIRYTDGEIDIKVDEPIMVL